MNHYKNLILAFLVGLFMSPCGNQIGTVRYSWEGCFGSGQQELAVFKKDGLIKARLTVESGKEYNTVIDKHQLDSFYLFIKDLKNLNTGGFCTTVSWYAAVVNN